jgi:hypothetical protein
MAQLLRKAVADDGPAALALVDILTQDQPAMAHRDLCAQVLAGAERAGADGRLLAAARYAVALRCGEDPAAAKEIAAAYLDQHRSRIETNNDAWSLMTALGTRGRFDSFALALVERMLEQEAVMEDFEFDTAALAMFLNGKVERAVELQQRAVDKGGVDNPEYGERLQRYRGAQPPR